MEIYEDFDFFDDMKDDFYNLFHIHKEEVEEAIKAINDSINWIESSIYAKCFKNCFVVLTDSLDEKSYAFVHVSEELEKIYIEVNLMDMFDDYKKGWLSEIIFEKKVSLYTYFVFFMLHEFGHIIHFQLEMQSEKKDYLKVNNHFYKYVHLHETFELKNKELFDGFYQDDDLKLKEECDKKLQKKYRKIPTEKIADSFAFNNLHHFKLN